MHEIDLGEDEKFKIKYRGSEYLLREPTVKELKGFQDQSEGGSVDAIDDFLAALGLPKGLVQDMGMSKAKKLLDSIVEVVSKKK